MAEVTRETQCSRCGLTVTGDHSLSANGQAYCRKCTLELASEIIADSDTREEKRKVKVEEVEKARAGRGRLFTVVKWAVFFAAVAVLFYRMPVVTGSLAKEKPLRYGTYDTDVQGDECINRLWEVSDRFVRGGDVIVDLTCPLSGKSYNSRETAGKITVYCPNPGLHDLMEMKVSMGAPVPVVR